LKNALRVGWAFFRIKIPFVKWFAAHLSNPFPSGRGNTRSLVLTEPHAAKTQDSSISPGLRKIFAERYLLSPMGKEPEFWV
jgi:hypothetical protein